MKKLMNFKVFLGRNAALPFERSLDPDQERQASSFFFPGRGEQRTML
jgi:hypothetical protein